MDIVTVYKDGIRYIQIQPIGIEQQRLTWPVIKILLQAFATVIVIWALMCFFTLALSK